ncbi:MAG: hypothetical protein AB1547_13120, partial [Thermodesulfobacteriota bacterium]
MDCILGRKRLFPYHIEMKTVKHDLAKSQEVSVESRGGWGTFSAASQNSPALLRVSRNCLTVCRAVKHDGVAQSRFSRAFRECRASAGWLGKPFELAAKTCLKPPDIVGSDGRAGSKFRLKNKLLRFNQPLFAVWPSV